MDKNTLELALILLNDYRKAFVRYEEKVEEWHKQGYRPHYCIHGTNLWVDWDCACGACEMDDRPNYWSYQEYLRISLDEAKEAMEEMQRRLAIYIDLDRQGAPIDPFKFGGWVCEPVEAIKKLKPKPVTAE